MRLASCFAGLTLAVALSGCATLEFRDWAAKNRPLAESGAIPWSQYYEGLYAKASAANAPGDFLAQANEAIRFSKEYESGAITKDEFEYRQRAIRAAATRSYEQRQAQAQAQLATAVQLMQTSGPYTLPQPHPQVNAPTVLMGTLQGQSVSGSLKYCRYSNGVVTTISSVDLCPISNN